MNFFGGIEGGATHSKLVICNEDGECVSQVTGLGTNHWMVGIQECARRIVDMVDRAKSDAGIPLNKRLTSLGLCLSGCEQEATNIELEKELRRTYPDAAESYVVGSDTMGSIFTASSMGGLVIIAGTGSNTLLRNPDGSTFGCGGWGNFLGDEGSAWYISRRAIKITFDDMDNFQKSPYPVQRVWELIKSHFNISNRLDLLDHCYAKFDKPFFAGLCKKLSAAALDGDKLCQFLFKEAGRHLAQFIHAVIPNVQETLIESGELSVVCVGSVWISWELLREGFIKELNRLPIRFGLKLMTIIKSSAYGSMYLGADNVGYDLPRNYCDNFKVMHRYQQNGVISNGNS